MLLTAAFRGPFTKPTIVFTFGILICALSAAMSVLSVYVNVKALTYLVSPAFLVEGKSSLEFTYIIILVVICVVQTFSQAYANWTGSVVALYWQKQLIGDMESSYFKSEVIYAANKMV